MFCRPKNLVSEIRDLLKTPSHSRARNPNMFRSQQINVVVTLDLSAALDRVDITAIIYKFASHGLKGNMLRWLEKYMKGRSRRVWVENKSSVLHKIISSVPHGSSLVPILSKYFPVILILPKLPF